MAQKRSAEDAQLDSAGAAGMSRTHYRVDFPDGSGSYTFERKPWESATAFNARCGWVDRMRGEGLGTDTQKEAEEVDRLSAMWYNMVYLGCRYDEELEERLGNPTSLVKLPEKEGEVSRLDAARIQQAAAGTRTPSWAPKV